MTTIIVRSIRRETSAFVMTLPNTEDGMEILKSVRAAYKEEGKTLIRYGRGPRRQIYEERAKDSKNWESRFPWTPSNNRFYRPKLSDCTHFDVYVNSRRKRNWL